MAARHRESRAARRWLLQCLLSRSRMACHHVRGAPELPLEPSVGNLSVPAASSPTKPVGDGHDYSAVVAGPITKATGSFADVSPHIKEQGQYDGSGPQLKNTFTLQLNTQILHDADVLRK